MKSNNYGLIEILYRDGTSDSFYASVGVCEKIGEEMLKGDCLIQVNCQNRKGIEFFSADVNKLSMVIDIKLIDKIYNKPEICQKCEFAKRAVTGSPCQACYGYYFKPMQSGCVHDQPE